MPVAARFRCRDGTYLCAEKGGGQEINATRAIPAEWETFKIVNPPRKDLPINHGEGSLFQCYNNQWVSAEGGGGGAVNANRSQAGTWEIFKILHADGSGGEIADGQNIALKTFNDVNYVCAENSGGGQVVANREAIGPWETFTIEFAKDNQGNILYAPIQDYWATTLGDGQYMESTARLQKNGEIFARNRIWTTNGWSGFTGQAWAIMYDQAQNVIGFNDLGSYGVDGTYIPGAPDDRTEYSKKKVDDNIYNNTLAFHVRHTKNPQGARAWLNGAVEAGMKIGDVISNSGIFGNKK